VRRLLYLVGYGFAYGTNNGSAHWFIGTGNFALKGATDAASYVHWLFNWAFASVTVTIVAGSVAERCKFGAYVGYSVLMTTLVYPVIAHWCAAVAPQASAAWL
jgi:ammonium transporter, Amt family